MIWSPKQESPGVFVETAGFNIRDRFGFPVQLIEFQLKSFELNSILTITHSEAGIDGSFFGWTRKFQSREEAIRFTERFINRELLRMIKSEPGPHRRQAGSRLETG